MKITQPNNSAAALIIVLAFVVLLTGLVVAYFSRTVADRQVAQGSFNQTKTDQLAMSATDLIITDLKQEIANGSASPAPVVQGIMLYYPSPAASPNMLPMRSGTPGPGATPIPNLVRRSVREDPIPAPGVGSRAAAINSTTDLSANGRSISAARWNKHYLIPRFDPSSLATDSTPVTSFTSPDWVFVTSNGPVAAPIPSSVLGRYAYAIYDEGGLLDANVVGYPHATPTPAQAPPVPPQPINAPSPPYAPGTYPPGFDATTYTAQQLGRKGNPVFADLSVLPAAATTFFPPEKIDNLAAWRNYATAQPGGDFSNNFSFDVSSASNYFRYVLSATNGFLKTSGNVWNGRSDQTLLNRQQLLNLRSSLGAGTPLSQNVLQYLGTFSRELNSPSFKPSTLVTPNADFLATRATSAFTRFDQTKAVIGEPFVKTRFPLNRLAWITYNGPSASVYAANNSDPIITALLANGVTLQTITSGTAANISACFGLTYGGGYWWHLDI